MTGGEGGQGGKGARAGKANTVPLAAICQDGNAAESMGPTSSQPHLDENVSAALSRAKFR